MPLHGLLQGAGKPLARESSIDKVKILNPSEHRQSTCRQTRCEDAGQTSTAANCKHMARSSWNLDLIAASARCKDSYCFGSAGQKVGPTCSSCDAKGCGIASDVRKV